jgi:protocatechuate 4,5-dioxygenase beta chain
MWLAMRGALSAAGPKVSRVHSNYHIPISNTATAVLALAVD